MKLLLIPLLCLFALAAGCDKKPTDPPKPKASLGLVVPPAA